METALSPTLFSTGHGWKGYVSDGFNCLDGFVVSISILEIIISAGVNGTLLPSGCSVGLNPSVLRTLRMVRLLVSLPIPSLKELLRMMAMALSGSGSLCILLALFLYTFTLLGAEHSRFPSLVPQLWNTALPPSLVPQA